MNIKGQKVKLLDGTITEVLEHETYLYISVNGIVKKYNYEMAFKKGGLTTVDPAIQKAIMDELAEQDRIKSEKEKVEVEERRITEEKAAEEAKLHPTTNTTKGRGSTKVVRKGSAADISSDCALVSMKPYGTRAQDIYDECCKSLDFNISGRGKFGVQQELYAMNATNESYSVWFLAHSNWTATKNGKWSNEIFDGIKHIDEHWDDPTISRFGEDAELRVTFAKQKNGVYVFLGIYKCLFIDDDKRVKRYEMLSDKYPEDK